MDKLKERLRQIDWWETTYLIIYGVIFAHEFEYTTMFDVDWPPKIGYVFMAVSALYTIAKFIWHNTYTKKEMILSVLIIIAFVMPAILTDYSFIFWVGFLIVGAKDVDFKKILKVYLVISITFMVVAFSASQYGLIEDLQYVATRGEETFVRHSFGIAYPTDYASHMFFIVLAAVVLYDEWSIMTKTWVCLLVAGSVYFTSNAQTTMLCLVGFVGLSYVYHVLGKRRNILEVVLQWSPIGFALGFLWLASYYNLRDQWIMDLNKFLSGRLEISRTALELYDIKIFGQYIPEIGGGSSVEFRPDYFFLDNSYVRILLEYGLFLFVVTLLMLILTVDKARKIQEITVILAIFLIALHSVMEHHLIDIAYNPMILLIFAKLSRKRANKQEEKCIEETVKAG